jgi:hypothetical protein
MASAPNAQNRVPSVSIFSTRRTAMQRSSESIASLAAALAKAQAELVNPEKSQVATIYPDGCTLAAGGSSSCSRRSIVLRGVVERANSLPYGLAEIRNRTRRRRRPIRLAREDRGNDPDRRGPPGPCQSDQTLDRRRDPGQTRTEPGPRCPRLRSPIDRWSGARSVAAPLDKANVMLRCGSCHTRKTNLTRAKRHSLLEPSG